MTYLHYTTLCISLGLYDYDDVLVAVEYEFDPGDESVGVPDGVFLRSFTLASHTPLVVDRPLTHREQMAIAEEIFSGAIDASDEARADYIADMLAERDYYFQDGDHGYHHG